LAGLVAALSAGLSLGCSRGGPAPAAAAESAREPVETELAVMPNNLTLVSAANRITAIGTEGELAWQLTLPDGDVAIAPVSIALNSVTYVRGGRALHAVLPEGKCLWSKPLDGQAYPRSRASNSPIAMSDSTVAVIVGDDVVRYDYQGNVRWRVSIPEGHVVGKPVAGMDGSLRVQTTSGVYSVNPDGQVSWRRLTGS
jgi:outer membrane protein assembly factor BamB